MITNPLPKNGLFATLNANEVAGYIESLPEYYRITAWEIYYGTVNLCSEAVDATIKATQQSENKESSK